MRIVQHPNIVELKAFYYSNGERVSLDGSANCAGLTFILERRGLPQFDTRIRTRDSLQSLPLFQQAQDRHAHS
jgi:hypothetical protein